MLARNALLPPGRSARPSSVCSGLFSRRVRITQEIYTGAAHWVAVQIFALAVLYPALTTPLIADDFLNPFDQFRQSGAGLGRNLGDAWKIVFSGASFRPVGGLVGALYNWWWLQANAHLGLGIETAYALTKAAVFSFTITAGTLVIARVLRLLGSTTHFSRIHFAFAAVFSLTLQIHGGWSNDPVVSYPLSGFLSTSLSLIFLWSMLGFVQRPCARGTIFPSFLAVFAVANYELSFGAVLGGSLLVFLFAVLMPQVSTNRRRLALVGQVPLVVSIVFVVCGRVIVGSASSTYAGTTVRIDHHFPFTAVRTLASSLPASAWVLSRDALGGSVALSARTLIVAVVALAAGTMLVLESGQTKPDLRLARRLIVAPVAMLLTYWLSAAGLQAMTVKVQDEAPRIGYVYTHYAVGATVVAVIVALLLLLVPWSRVRRPAVALSFGALSILSTVQLTVNWRLAERLRQTTIPNQNLIESYSENRPFGERCAALRDWTAGQWPAYYENQMVDGIKSAFQHFHGEEFCGAYVPNP